MTRKKIRREYMYEHVSNLHVFLVVEGFVVLVLEYESNCLYEGSEATGGMPSVGGLSKGS